MIPAPDPDARASDVAAIRARRAKYKYKTLSRQECLLLDDIDTLLAAYDAQAQIVRDHESGVQNLNRVIQDLNQRLVEAEAELARIRECPMIDCQFEHQVEALTAAITALVNRWRTAPDYELSELGKRAFSQRKECAEELELELLAAQRHAERSQPANYPLTV